ncbi:MAG: copper chaperone PCu(A)C [Anaerolineae bacterium]|nr:copper chaperone PCu(A)C [Anaerolineae bacterium]
MRALSITLLGLLLVGMVGCAAAPTGEMAGAAPGPIVVTEAWVRAAVTGNSAAYMIIRNHGSAPDRLVRAAADMAAAVELHETKMEGGMMKMAPVDGIAIPAGGQVELKPGGLHIMLIGLKQELKAGTNVQLKLHFEKAGTLEVVAQVRPSTP